MAEYRFSALYFKAVIEDGSILIEFSLDVDEDSIGEGNIFVMNKVAGRIEPFQVIVTGRTVRLNLISSPAPDVPYTIVVNGGIKAITGEKIESAVIRTIVFESSVKSSVRIVSPANFQKLRNLEIKLSEEGDHPVNCFQLEIARENGFYNILRNLELTDINGIAVSDLEKGQYYIRARAFSGDNYGPWSRIITFTIEEPEKAVPAIPGIPVIEDLTDICGKHGMAEKEGAAFEIFDDEIPDRFTILSAIELAPLPCPGLTGVSNDSVSVTVTRRLS